MYSLVLYFILSSVFVSLLGRFFGSRISTPSSIALLFFSSLSSVWIFYEVTLRGFTCEVTLFNWIDFFTLYSPFTLYYDKLSSTMLMLVTFISFSIHLYSYNYMKEDPCKIRFFFYLSLSTFFMCFMVVSGSLVQFFFAWEGVGLVSHLLIGFWYTRIEANRSAMKAMIINRFGDFGLYLAILLIFAFHKTLTFSTLNALSHIIYLENLQIDLFVTKILVHDVICFFLFIAVVGKSAQLGLHTWLPDAMEGPTPVSALLHAATMVTAGVYLSLRLSNFFESAPNVLIIITIWGALTAFFTASIGAFQNDIKKIIAYSTCSQLGYMIAACGMNNFVGAFYHLFNHAFFKALLFLGAGVIIHSSNNEQDIRKYGGLLNYLPFTYICMVVSSLSLMGLPFMSGFYSKDIILNWSFSIPAFHSNFAYWLLIFAASLTAFYSTKLLNLTFLSKPRFSKNLSPYINEIGFGFKIPMFVLAFLSRFSGYIFYDSFVGMGSETMNLSLDINQNYLIENEYLHWFRKLIPLVFVCFGIIIYFLSHHIYNNYFILMIKHKNYLRFLLIWKNFFNKKWFFDFLYYRFSKSILIFIHEFLFKSIDKGFIEDIFVKKPIFIFFNSSKLLFSFQTGNINHYIFFISNAFLILALLIYLTTINPTVTILIIFYFLYKSMKKWKK